MLATKFGVLSHLEGGVRRYDGRPENVRLAVEGSLRRLDTDRIDLYYQHRPDPSTPVEETAGALAELVEEGKILAYGLSEADPETIVVVVSTPQATDLPEEAPVEAEAAEAPAPSAEG